MRLLQLPMVRWVWVAGIAAALLLWSPSGPRPASAAGDCTVSGADAALDADEQAFLVLINNYRAQNGLTALKVSYFLTRSSSWKSKHMGVNAYFAHDDTPIGRSWSQRTRDCGYTYNTGMSENIAAGYPNAQAVFDGWKNSPGHNSNMLGSGYTAIGIGKVVTSGSPYGTYWTTVFGGFDDGWVRASGEIAPLESLSIVSGTPSVGEAAHSAAAPNETGGGGARSRRLDFSRMCELLQERRPDAWRRICGRAR